MSKIAYKRVSTVDQNLDRQLPGMKFDKVFVEKISGKNMQRPQLIAMLDYIREGDTVHIHDLSRLARSLFDLQSIVDSMLNKGVSIIFHKENFEFIPGEEVSAIQKMLFHHLAVFAEFERDLILERQKEGIAIAKSKGLFKGRQSKFSNADIKRLKQMFNNAKKMGRSKKAIAEEVFGISESYAYRLIKKIK